MNQIKGYNYEIQIRDYIINSLNKPAYLWNDVPENILIEFGIIGTHNENRIIRKDNKLNSLIDTGIDVIQIDDKSISLVQCKNGYQTGLTIKDLAGFNAWMCVLDKFNGYVYYTNKLSQNILGLPKNSRIQYIKQEYITPNIVSESTYTPFDYQLNAVECYKEYFKTNNRGILKMPCGVGKTYTSYLISKLHKQTIIISPLRQFARQNLDKYKEYGYSNKSMLIDIDGNRDINDIEKFILENNEFLLSATFCSVDCIQQILSKCNNPLIIIDEFHNISKTNLLDKDDYFYKLLDSNSKIMFMSATPRVYELEDYDFDFIFGNIFYNMSMNEAIANKYITDYRIWYPAITEDNTDLENDLSIYNIDNTIKAKCQYLFSCLSNIGSKKCIIYCIDTNEINLMISAIKILDNYYNLELEMWQITSSDSGKKRQKTLLDFATSDKRCLLFSIRILDECIDIPSCDSIYITHESKSKIRTIQRLSRCTRINKLDKYKIGNVFIWCNDYSEILTTLSAVKESDIDFKDKIKINCINFYGKTTNIIIEENTKVIQNYIVGIKEFKQCSWYEKLNELKIYLDENKCRPTEDKILNNWLSHQITNYNKKLCNMKDSKVYDTWTKFINDKQYSGYFDSTEDKWYKKLNELKLYIDINQKRPTESGDSLHLYNWLSYQLCNYEKVLYIMKNKDIYKVFKKFITNSEYSIYFVDNTSLFYKKFYELKNYLDTNKKRPTENGKFKVLRGWLQHQLNNYKNKTDNMKNKEIYDTWTEFINDKKYLDYFKSNEEKFYEKLTELKIYLDKYNKRPSSKSKDENTRILGNWLVMKNKCYKNKKYIMKDVQIYNTWSAFITSPEYSKYF